ncbi:MAG: hypothetical protein M5U13_15810 [Thermoanaerobaculia bacterium]|nr:hypothetical protein [Thermoanaerobaculia bacterium]
MIAALARTATPKTELLRWSDHVPLSEAQDPLGLSLRGSTRLASRLLYCVTSNTPRARYFSFLPWAVSDWTRNEKPTKTALGLKEAIVLREKALVLGCVAHHAGTPCDQGRLVGSDSIREWFRKGLADADLRKLPFAKKPALDVYLNSLVNLGAFVSDDERPDSDESDPAAGTFDDLRLAPLGEQLAQAYAEAIGRLPVLPDISSRARRCSLTKLRQLGRRGCFCALPKQKAPEVELLRDIFFASVPLRGEAHRDRKRSLLLLLELCRQLSADGWLFNEALFRDSTYFGEVVSDEDDLFPLAIPDALTDIATRWRMFYFHHYMSVALEGMFAWLVGQAGAAGLAGCSLGSLTAQLNAKSVRSALSGELDIPVSSRFGASTPSDLFSRLAGTATHLDAHASLRLDQALRAGHAVSELRLEELIRKRQYSTAPAGLALPLVLLGLTLSRFARWEETPYGYWLANAATDPYLDLVPPVLTAGLSGRFGSWWEQPWEHLARYILSRYVVQQHQSLSYEKSAAGDRCLLQADGDRVATNPGESYEKIGLGNPRWGSALQILVDLGLIVMDDYEVPQVSEDGLRLLETELAQPGLT